MSEGRKKENGIVVAPAEPLLEGTADNDRKIMLSAVIGSTNVNRWTRLKATFGCETEEEFVTVLLDIAEKHGGYKEKLITKHENERPDKENEAQTKQQPDPPINKKDHKHKRKKNPKPKKPITVDAIPSTEPAKPSNPELLVPLEPNVVCVEIAKNPKKIKLEDTKKQEHDIRKAPELVIQKEVVKNEPIVESSNEDDGESQRLAIKIKMCTGCDTRHLQDQCPLQKPRKEISDVINYKIWVEQYKSPYENHKYKMEEQEINELNKFSFVYQSLPRVLCFAETDTPHGLGVFAAEDLEEFTQFGPLIGNIVKEMDIPEDCNMRDMFQISKDGTNIYFCTEDFSISNWIRCIRPAPTRENKNVLAVVKGEALYFTTVKKVSAGEELVYWQDDFVSNNKKKMEKNTCGGCNMTFSHPLYYRLHCSAFHDIRYSLTIRKYHCKVCGEAVLGKDNIMKHAVELHNGQGAYQCQFCKKFFLRLNYLEMHRTYGCSANPHRSRPLCDFCGRKFCQPQKLKIHIKRMHSDMSEVLKEFQCKNCMKILGSRAALQRHLKEVHQKQLDGACTCSKCGKLFQNKSNLKIHMLTHSGIKPFKCAENNCAAGFTTKQCLQFHYKKVHGFTEDMMPKIERSVDYTFEAYSGGDEPENMIKNGNGDSNFSDQEDNSMEDKTLDETLQVDSPQSNSKEQLSPSPNNSNPSPTLESFTQNTKILSKGSKKWIEDQQNTKEDIQITENNIRKMEHIEMSDEPKLTFPRHESSNASLLVEAALDSVCSDANIDIDVSTTPTDTLVNNLYTLSHGDTLGDVGYNHSDSRDINLISPSVNDQISVTDDQNMGIDYSSFHQEDFSPATSPTRINFVRDYINANSPHTYENQVVKNASPPRYDFGAAVNQESDDSNGMGAQNLSLHNTVKENIQLDLSIYKSHYGFDPINFIRKSKYEEQQDRTKGYVLEVQKGYEVGNLESDLSEKDLEGMQQDGKHKDDVDLDLSMRADLRNKFELDLDLRKGYEIDDMRRTTTYDSSLDDFRMKSYDLDSLELRNKTYENLMEDFRTDRNFEPLVLNPSELQGLDMSARGYHNYSNLNRYHHLYPEVDRPSVDLRMNYSPPPPPTYSHTDILRVVSLDLTPPGRHSVDLSLRSHQISNSRLLTDHSIQSARLGLDQSRLLSSEQSRLLSSDQSRLLSSEQSRLLTSDQSRLLSSEQSRLLSSELTSSRHIGADGRIISDMSNRILSDHTTNRILSNDQLPTNRLLSTEQRILSDDSRLLPDQQRLLDQSRMLGDSRLLSASNNGSISPVPYTGYSVSPGTYHPTALAPPRTHTSSPNPPSYHHYTAYY